MKSREEQIVDFKRANSKDRLLILKRKALELMEEDFAKGHKPIIYLTEEERNKLKMRIQKIKKELEIGS